MIADVADVADIADIADMKRKNSNQKKKSNLLRKLQTFYNHQGLNDTFVKRVFEIQQTNLSNCIENFFHLEK